MKAIGVERLFFVVDLEMAFVRMPLFVRSRKPRRIGTCMTNERVQTAKSTLLDATTGLNLGRDIAKQPDKLNHIQGLIKNLEAEWKRDDATNVSLAGRRQLVYTTLPDVLAIDKPRWMQCAEVFHTIEEGENAGRIEQVFDYGMIRFAICFRFELSVLRLLRRKVRFVEAMIGRLMRFDMKKRNLVGSLLVRFSDDDLLVLEGNKGGISILRLLE